MSTFNAYPRDAKNRPLTEGDEVLLHLKMPVFFRVAQITPILDPGVRPGSYHVHVGTMLTFTMKGGAAHAELIRVATAEEVGPSAFKLLDAQPAGSPKDS